MRLTELLLFSFILLVVLSAFVSAHFRDDADVYDRSCWGSVGDFGSCEQRVGEYNTCLFLDTKKPQFCKSDFGGCLASVKVDRQGDYYASCKLFVYGPYNKKVHWFGSCGGTGFSTIDGEEETIRFFC